MCALDYFAALEPALPPAGTPEIEIWRIGASPPGAGKPSSAWIQNCLFHLEKHLSLRLLVELVEWKLRSDKSEKHDGDVINSDWDAKLVWNTNGRCEIVGCSDMALIHAKGTLDGGNIG